MVNQRIIVIILLTAAVIGLGFGILAVRNQVTVKNEATTLPIPGSCLYKTSRCEVDPQYSGGAFRIIVYEDGSEMQPTGAPGQVSLTFVASTDRKYYCKVVALDNAGQVAPGPDCTRIASGQPVCTPNTPVVDSPTPIETLTPTLTPAVPSQSPTPEIPLACPQYDYNIILRPVTQ